MYIKICKLFILLSLFSLVVSCKKSSSTPTPDTSFIPLKTGNKWNYSKVIYNEDGTERLDTTTSLEVFQSDNINNNTWYITSFSSTGLQRSTADRLLYTPNNGSNVFWPQLGSTTQASEIILDTIFSGVRQQIIAYGNTETINGYDAIKNVTNIFNNTTDSIFNYSEYYVKPQLGIVQINDYLSKNISGGAPFYLFDQLKLTSYSLK